MELFSNVTTKVFFVSNFYSKLFPIINSIVNKSEKM